MPAISKQGLVNIVNHKYVAGTYTPLDNLMNPMWLALTDLLPLWIAPNLVTMTGFMCNFSAFCLLLFFQPTMSEIVPAWVLYYCACALVSYQTLDAMDGKQARRTGSSSPLGQLFDHGIDCICLIQQHTLLCAVFGLGASFANIYFLATVYFGFFMAQWSEYHTHVLPTACGPVGVTEFQLLVAGLCLFSAGIDHTMYTARTYTLSPALVECVKSVLLSFNTEQAYTSAGVFANGSISFSIVDGVVVVWTLFVVTVVGWFVVTSIAAIVENENAGNKNKNKGRKDSVSSASSRSLLSKVVEASVQTIPPLAIAAMAVTWPTEVRTTHTRVITMMTGVVMSHLSNNMVLCSTAQDPFPFFDKCTVPYIALWLSTFSPSLTAIIFASHSYIPILVLAVVLALSIMWVNEVLALLTEALDVYVFVITRKPSQEAKPGKKEN